MNVFSVKQPASIWLPCLLSLFALSSEALAVNCPSTDYFISTESQLNSFEEDMLTCDVVLGSVVITELTLAEQRWLNLNLERISGTLRLSFTNLEGVTSQAATSDSPISYVGSLYVDNNPNLTGIYLDRLTAPPFNVSISGNDALHSVLLRHHPDTSLVLESITVSPEYNWLIRENYFCDGQLVFDFSPTRLVINGGLVIDQNTCLGTVHFGGLAEIEGNLTIRQNGATKNNALGTTQYLGTDSGGTRIEVIGGFKDLERIAGSLEVGDSRTDNPGLTSVSFPKLAETESIVIRGPDIAGVNFPLIESLSTLGLSLGGAGIGPGSFATGPDWGFGRLNQTRTLAFIMFGNAAPSSLSALNIHDLSLGSDLILVGDARPVLNVEANGGELSLSSIVSVPSEIRTLFMVNGRFSGTSALKNIEVIGGNLILSNIDFFDLDFLSGVRTIEGQLAIRDSRGGSLNGIEGIQSVAADFNVQDNTLDNCDALLPLVGWGTATPSYLEDINVSGNTPSMCNGTTLTTVKNLAAPQAISGASSQVGRDGVQLSVAAASASDLFPVVRYFGECRSDYRKSFANLGQSTTDLQANTQTTRTLSFGKAGQVEAMRVGVNFQTVDRSELTFDVDPPGIAAQKTIWKKAGTGTKGWEYEFTSSNSALSEFIGANATGDWALKFSPGPTAAKLSSYYIDIDSLFQQTVSASAVVDNNVEISMTGLPSGDTFECRVIAENEFGIRSETSAFDSVTPPPITDTPVITEIESTNDGLLVYFTPPPYFGSQWFGSVMYSATCTADNGQVQHQSDLVASSPALITGTEDSEFLNCTVAIDNVYESVDGAAYVFEPTATGLPIWLLYEASRQQ